MIQQINLVNPAFRKEYKAFSAGVAAIGLAVAWVIMLIGHWGLGMLTGPLESRKSELVQKQSEAGASITKLQELAKSRKPSKELEEENGRLESTLRFQRELLLSLETGGLGSAEGFSRYLAALARQRVDGVWLTKITTIVPDNLALSGRALRPELVPAYIKQLGRESVLQGHAFSELSAKTQKSAAQQNAGDKPADVEKFVEFTLSASAEKPGGGN